MSNFSFINKGSIKNSTFVLDEKESHHVVSVLRLKENDQLTLTDGQGTIYKAILNEAHKKAVKGKILNKEFIKHERNYKVHLALPLIKNSRFKIALEKSVELGFLTGAESQKMKDAHVDSVMIVGEPYQVFELF